MTTRLAACLSLALALYLGQLFAGYAALRLILLVILLLLPAAWLWLQLSWRRLKFDQQLAIPLQERGGDGLLQLRLVNRQLAAFSQVKLQIRLPGASDQPRTVQQQLTLLPGDTQKISLSYPCPHCGEYAVGLVGLQVTDLFGLFRIRIRRRTRLAGSLLQQVVLPRVNDQQNVLLPGLLLAEQSDEPSPRVSSEVDAIANLREMQSGDSFKRIHWKVSARLGEWIVKEFEDPLQHEIIVIVDPAPLAPGASLPRHSSQPCADRVSRLDFLAETVLSLIDPLVHKHHRLSLLTWSPHRELETGDQDLDVLRFQIQLSRMATAADQAAARAVFADQVFLETSTSNYGFVVVVTWQLSRELAEQLIQARLRHPRVCLLLLAARPEDLPTEEDQLPVLSAHEVDWLVVRPPANAATAAAPAVRTGPSS